MTRTAILDEILLRTIHEQQVDTVLNLATGFDARPWRMALPPALRWVDVDLPAMLEEKAAIMTHETPRCRYEAIGVDVSDEAARRALLARVGSEARRVLVLTEGLLIYLEPTAVAALAADLATVPSIRWWLMDLASPELLQRMERNWAPVVRTGNAPFRFGPAENTGFFAPFGWKELEFRSTLEEAVRIGRAFRFARVLLWLGRLAPPAARNRRRRFSGYALLERSRDTTPPLP